MKDKPAEKNEYIGECAKPDSAFKSNSNMSLTPGVAPLQVQHGHGKPVGGQPSSTAARGHGSR